MMAGIGSLVGVVAAEAAGWLLTYAVHSTLLLGCAALLTARLVRADVWRDTVWKAALLGGVVTATLQTGLGFRPLAGEWRLPAGVVAAAVEDRATPEPLGGTTGAVLAVNAGERPGGMNAAAEPNVAAQSGAQAEAMAPASATGGAHAPATVRPSHESTTVIVSAGEPEASSPVERRARDVATPAERGAPARSGDGTPAWLLALLGVWSMGAVLLLARLAHRHFRLLRLLRDRDQVTDGSALSLLAALRRNAGVWRPVRLTTSAACPTPLALGTSEICVPERFLRQLDAEQQRSALAHELAHLSRRDPAWHLAAGIFEAVLFFQPLNRLARLRLREAAENLCDDWAVRQTGSAVGLARCLAEVASWVGRGAEPVPSGTMAMAEGGSPLLRRVERLLAERRDVVSRGVRLRSAAAAGLVVLVAVTAPAVSAPGDAGSEVALRQRDAGPSGALRRGDARGTEPSDPPAGAQASAEEGGTEQSAAHVAGAPGNGARRDGSSSPNTQPAAAIPAAAAVSWGRLQEAVIRHPSPGEPLERRWPWAETEARRRGHSEYWVAYAFERVLPADDRHVDDSGAWSTDELGGPPLGRLVFGPAYALPAKGSGPVRQPVLVLFHVTARDSRPARVDRVSVRTASAGMFLGGDPVYWLGAAAEAESFDWLRRRVDELDGLRLRGTVVEAIAMHEDATRVVPLLGDIVHSDRNDAVREEAVEGLAWHPTEPAVALLRTTALEDRSVRIREEAAETLGELNTPQASAALEQIVRSRTPDRVRGEAVEAMAGRPAPEVLETLVRVAMEDPDREIQEEAVETIAEFPAESAAPALERIVREHTDVRTRREAVESLGELDPAAAAEVLEVLLQSDSPRELREEAIDVIAERPSPRALQAIVRVAFEDPDPELQEEAVETLAEFAPADAAPHLKRIIWEHPAIQVRREAVEALSELPADVALPLLDEVVAGHTDGPVLEEAVDAIAEFPSELSVPRLLRIVREHPRAEVRREALDRLGKRMR